MNKRKNSPWVVGFLSLVVVGLLYVKMGGESYFFLYPSIDTYFAPGYSESAFERVKVGMTKDEVMSLLGPPIDAQTVGQNRWRYTQDGKCFWANWAWIDRTVYFKDQRVTQKVARIRRE